VLLLTVMLCARLVARRFSISAAATAATGILCSIYSSLRCLVAKKQSRVPGALQTQNEKERNEAADRAKFPELTDEVMKALGTESLSRGKVASLLQREGFTVASLFETLKAGFPDAIPPTEDDFKNRPMMASHLFEPGQVIAEDGRMIDPAMEGFGPDPKKKKRRCPLGGRHAPPVSFYVVFSVFLADAIEYETTVCLPH
jgi:hypothetical protein